jgi:hypothetical protein
MQYLRCALTRQVATTATVETRAVRAIYLGMSNAYSHPTPTSNQMSHIMHKLSCEHQLREI